jgi:hypothetical protein
MSKYIRITERIAGKLKPKEAYLYYCLALKSDFHTHESDIKQETLANEYGIKDTDQISDWLYHFQSCGLLTIIKTNIKGQYGRFQRSKYQLNTEHYVLISSVLHNEPISRQLKGFLLLLKCKCLNGTNTTLYSQAQLANELKIAKSSLSNYLSEAKARGYLCKDEKGIHLLRDDIFLMPNTPKPDFRRRKVKDEAPIALPEVLVD